MEERWFRLYLSSMVLVPLGLVCLIWGATRPVASEKLAITLVTLGTGLLVFGAFGPRMEGAFKFGPSGAEGGLSEATQAARLAAQRRLTELHLQGTVQAADLPRLEQAAQVAVEQLAASFAAGSSRGFLGSATDQLGRSVADALATAVSPQLAGSGQSAPSETPRRSRRGQVKGGSEVERDQQTPG